MLDNNGWEIGSPDISSIDLGDFGQGHESFTLGVFGVTRIQKTSKPGEYCNIPYVRVWKDDAMIFEVCQHKLCGVSFRVSP